MPVTAVAQEASRSPERPSVRATRDPAGSRAQAWLFVVVFFCVVSGIDFLYWVAEVEASAGHRLLLQGLAMIVFWKLLQVECRPWALEREAQDLADCQGPEVNALGTLSRGMRCAHSPCRISPY